MTRGVLWGIVIGAALYIALVFAGVIPDWNVG